MVLRELTYLAVALRIMAALLMGGIIGAERGLNNHSAGMRTYMLVCVGSCLIMMTNVYVYQATGIGDPLRMGAQVVSGIGFLGAGTIMVTRHNQIKGLTTAAGLWAAAGVGLAVGIGFYEAAVVGGVAIFVILTLLHHWDEHMLQQAKMLTIYAEVSVDLPIGEFVRILKKMDIELKDMQLDRSALIDDSMRAFVGTLRSKRRINHKKLLGEIRKIDGVLYLEEL